MERSRLGEQGPEGRPGDREQMARALLQAPAPVAHSQGCRYLEKEERGGSMWRLGGSGELRAAVLWGAGGLTVPSERLCAEPGSTGQSGQPSWGWPF